MSALMMLMLAVQTSTGNPVIETVVARGETLRQVAERTVGDVRAVSELQSLNALPASTRSVPEGTRLRIPGPERGHARSALNAAWATVRNSEAKRARASAEETLQEAERHFSMAHYDEASQLADAAWALASAAASSRQHFAVTVEAEGEITALTVHEGPAVRIAAQGVTRTVEAGETTRVRRGQPPPLRGTRQATATVSTSAPPTASPVRAVRLPAPAPVFPAAQAVLKLGSEGGGLGPVNVRFSPVAGAEAYLVRVTGEGNTHTVRATGTEARLPALAAGSYRWTVSAVKEGQVGARSAATAFTVEAAPLTLDVKGSGWQ